MNDITPDNAMTPVGVEVEWDEYEDRYVFEVPRTFEEARSAYAYDPVFNAAIDVYCDRKRMRPEECLRENTGMLLHVEKRLLGDLRRPRPEAMAPNMNKTEPTIRELKQMFVEDELTIQEFERRVEKRLAE